MLPIFIKIGSYLTDTEQKIKFARFWRHGVHACLYTVVLECIYFADSSRSIRLCETWRAPWSTRLCCR